MNTADQRLEVFTLDAGTPVARASIPVGLDPVSVRARSAREAIAQSGKDGTPIELLVRNQDHFRTVTVICPGGLRYPHLEPVAGKADGLKAILSPAG